MKSIIVHDIQQYGNKPILINVNAISAVEDYFDRLRHRTKIFVGNFTFVVAESFDTVIQKIKEAESGGEEEDGDSD